jgi:5-methylcytosine-specific restriction endonuclease McrA
MRALALPILDPQAVYQECINSIADKDLRYRLNLATSDIVFAASDYQKRAEEKQLYTIPPNNCGNGEIALGLVTKGELKDVYSSHMVGRAKPARAIYDELLSQAPLGKCPFCGFGQVSTLDHYLPKSKYPQLSVFPLNLVPSCTDCNTRKSAAIASVAERQSLHPYFDHQNFIDDQWLYAKLMPFEPAIVHFFVKPPDHWSDISKARVQSHFNDFKLASRYSVEASNELACLRAMLADYWKLSGLNGIKQDLKIRAQSYQSLHSNSWQTAMFQALIASDWYCDGGFL